MGGGGACKIVLTGVPVDGLKSELATSSDLEIKDLEEGQNAGLFIFNFWCQVL